MTARRRGRLRRLLADLRRPETRTDAVRRVRRRVGGVVPGGTKRTGARPAGATKAGRARRPPARHRSRPIAQRRPSSPGRPRLHKGEAALAEAIARGEPLEQAVCRSVTELIDADEWHPAWAIAEGVGRLAGGATASTLGHAVLQHRRRQFDRVWSLVEGLDDDVLATFIPVEAVDAALAAGTDEARRRALAISSPVDRLPASVLVDLAGRFLAFGERDAPASSSRSCAGARAVDLDDRRRRSWQLIEGWLAQRPVAVPAGIDPGRRHRLPDPRSRPDLGQPRRLRPDPGPARQPRPAERRDVHRRRRPRRRSPPSSRRGCSLSLRRPGATGAVHLLAVDRDFSNAEAVPPGTWMVAFGWHMHPLYDLRYDFPYHPNVRPLFLSFHVNRLDMLSDEAPGVPPRRTGPSAAATGTPCSCSSARASTPSSRAASRRPSTPCSRPARRPGGAPGRSA